MGNFIKQFFGSFTSPENIERMKQNLPLVFPEAMENSFMTYMLERGYLEDVASNDTFRINNDKPWMGGWLKINRIPVHPSNELNYDLLSRWQATLSTFHTWNEKIVFVLSRQKGQTSLYVGTSGVSIKQAQEKGETALLNNMPGIDVSKVDLGESLELITKISAYQHVGAITGIPSFRENIQYSVLQTLDQLAFGIRDFHGEENDYSLMVIADPINDADTSDIIRKYQKLGSEIHTDVKHSLGEDVSVSESRSNQVGIGAVVSSVGNVALSLAGLPLVGEVLAYVTGGMAQRTSSKQIQFSRNIGSETLNKFAEYTEKLTDMHATRLRDGRSTGFWNVGVYVLGDRDSDVNTLLGMLRSIYSGDKSYIEPIRIHQFQANAVESVKSHLSKMNLVPIKRPDIENTSDEWHVLGHNYQYLSTPVNTTELSLFTSLPRKDVPGLRFVKTAVRFANNPGENLGDDVLSMGHIIDTGVEQRNEYKIDVHSLVRHSLIVGGTGCGKTTTCKSIINEVLSKDIPVLIIEPVKDEYVRWAMAQRKQGKKVNIFMPGMEGEDFIRLKLNPFQPAAIEGAPIDMLSRSEQFTALINASLPASDVLPVLIDETFYTYLKRQSFGADYINGEMNQLGDYPKLDGLVSTAKEVMISRGYSEEVGRGLSAALETRFNYLTRGKRGKIMNVYHSSSWADLFQEVTVVNLSKLANAKDKALIMSLLMLSLYEYRISAYTYDSEYRKKAQSNKLQHLTVVEEAHNVLTKPSADTQGTGNPQQVVADLFGNMLSEIRSYGEGLMIVDQVPTKLISDTIKNTNYKIVHRMTAPDDCELMEAALALREEQHGIIPLLAQGQALLSCDRDDAASWVKINKPIINL